MRQSLKGRVKELQDGKLFIMKIFKTDSDAFEKLKKEILKELLEDYQEYVSDYFDEYQSPENYIYYLSDYLYKTSQPLYCKCGEKRPKSFKLALENRWNGSELIYRMACICPECGE
jgi:CRISPR/Cas system CMR subunit Cmr6 (Cas7 group RAMP superfamily)